jgi:hypothetical protein
MSNLRGGGGDFGRGEGMMRMLFIILLWHLGGEWWWPSPFVVVQDLLSQSFPNGQAKPVRSLFLLSQNANEVL